MMEGPLFSLEKEGTQLRQEWPPEGQKGSSNSDNNGW